MQDIAVPQASPADLRAAHAVAVQLYLFGNEPPADLRHASAPHFSRDQRRHADRTSIALEREHFGFVADVEPVHLEALLKRPTLLRVMVCDDGTTTAGIYALRARPGNAVVRLALTATGTLPGARVLDLITTFDDGRVVITNNGQGMQPGYSWPAEIDHERNPQSTPPRALVARHRARVAAHRAAFPRARPVLVQDLATVTRLWSARSAAVNAHRRAVGYATDDELRSLLGRNHTRLAPLVRGALDVLAGADAA